MGFLNSSEFDLEVQGGYVDLIDYISTFDYGWNLGFGIGLGNNFFFQGRYHLGLVWDDIQVGFGEKFKQNNRVIQFSVGYLFEKNHLPILNQCSGQDLQDFFSNSGFILKFNLSGFLRMKKQHQPKNQQCSPGTYTICKILAC